MDSCSFQWCLVSRIQEGPSEYQEVLLCCVDEKALAQHAQRGCGVFSLEISKSRLDTQCWDSLLEQRELYQMISRGPFQTKPCCATPPSYLEAFVCGGFWLTFKCFWCFKKKKSFDTEPVVHWCVRGKKYLFTFYLTKLVTSSRQACLKNDGLQHSLGECISK